MFGWSNDSLALNLVPYPVCFVTSISMQQAQIIYFHKYMLWEKASSASQPCQMVLGIQNEHVVKTQPHAFVWMLALKNCHMKFLLRCLVLWCQFCECSIISRHKRGSNPVIMWLRNRQVNVHLHLDALQVLTYITFYFVQKLHFWCSYEIWKTWKLFVV